MPDTIVKFGKDLGKASFQRVGEESNGPSKQNNDVIVAGPRKRGLTVSRVRINKRTGRREERNSVVEFRNIEIVLLPLNFLRTS